MNLYIKKIILCLVILLGVNISNASASVNSEIEAMGFEYVEFDGQMVPVGKEVTIEDATKYVETKGYEFINFIVKVAKPITLSVMVFCGLMAIMSGLTGGKNSGSWVWAGIISAFCYTGIIFSPTILSMIINFFSV